MNILDDLKNGTLDVEEFLNEQDEDVVQSRLFERVDPDLDPLDGGYLQNAITPASFEFSIAYIAMKKVLDEAFIQNSFGERLALHAASRGAPKKEAQHATGVLHITVTSNATAIPEGAKFCTTVPEGSSNAPKYYTTTEESSVLDDNTFKCLVVSDVPGTEGNVAAGEIDVNIQSLPGIVAVTNPEAVTGGIDEEMDDALKERALERVQNPPGSGNKADYRRWAKEVPGVGDCKVQPRKYGPGTVGIVVWGYDGEAVSDDVIKAAQEYIDPEPHGEGDGKAPIGATVTISTVSGVEVNIHIPDLELESGYTIDDVRVNIIKRLSTYFAKLSLGEIVRVKNVESTIKGTPGVMDFSTIFLNDSQSNFQVAEEVKACLGEVIIDGS